MIGRKDESTSDGEPTVNVLDLATDGDSERHHPFTVEMPQNELSIGVIWCEALMVQELSDQSFLVELGPSKWVNRQREFGWFSIQSGDQRSWFIS